MAEEQDQEQEWTPEELIEGVHFNYPPVQEAICEFDFPQDVPWNGLLLVPLAGRLRSLFPNSELPEDRSNEIHLVNEEGDSLVKLAPYRVAIHVKSYWTWDTFSDLILSILDAYHQVVKPTSIIRIALRYINSIELTVGEFNLQDYFTIYPRTPSEGSPFSDGYTSFVIGLEKQYPDIRDTLTIKLFHGHWKDEKAVVFLDISYSFSEDEVFQHELVWQWLDSAHTQIKWAFLSCITDALRNQFEEVNDE